MQHDFVEKITLNNRVHTVSTTKTVVEGDDGEVFIAGITRDISGRVNLYRQLCDYYPGGVFVTGNEGELKYVNDNGARMFGYKKGKDLTGKNVIHLYHDPEDRKIFSDEIKKTGSVIDYDLLLAGKKGKVFTARITASVRWGEKGEIIGYHGTFVDVTAQKQRERDQKKCNDLLEQQLRIAKKEGGDFVKKLYNELKRVVKSFNLDESISERIRFERLTPREKEKFFLLVFTDKKQEDIAKYYGRAVDTIKSEVQIMCRKLEVRNGRKGLQKYAQSIGILPQ